MNNDERTDELVRVAVRLRNRKAYAPEIWEHQQLARDLVAEGKLSQEQCDRIIEVSGEITRL